MKILKLLFCTLCMCIIFGVGTSAANPDTPGKSSYDGIVKTDSMCLRDMGPTRTFNRWFISAGGGVGRLMAEDSRKLPFWKDSKPMWTISAGARITPVWGLRLQASGGTLQGFAIWNEGSGDNPGHGGGNWFLGEDQPNPIGRDRFNTYLEAAPDADPTIRAFIKNNYFDLDKPRTGKDGSKGYNYHFSYYSVMADLMVNLNNAIWGSSGRECPVQVTPFAGLGFAHTRKDGILPKVNSIAVRGGINAEVLITNCFALNVESGLTLVPEVFDRFVGSNMTQDAIFTLTAGLTYKFGKATPKSTKHIVIYNTVQPAVVEPKPEVVAEEVIECSGVIISGFVYDTDDNPVENAVVFIYDADLQDVLVLRTDKRGWYTTKTRCGAQLAVKAVKNGYMDDCLRYDVEEEKHNHGAILKEIPLLRLSRLVKNQIIRLENIHYDFDKWNIRPDAAVELDKVVVFMLRNPAVSVVLGSHTDVRGSDAYNEKLSQRRAESAVAYIISHGVSADRITAKGFGERVLLVKNPAGVPYTEEQHQANRRTEIMINDEGTVQLRSIDPWSEFVTGKSYRLDELPAGFFDNCMPRQ